MPATELVLLPGLDGTGKLFAEFILALPRSIEPRIVDYPRNRVLGYPELRTAVKESLPSDRPYVLLAESFSSPLAVQIAASHPESLKALVICAGFLSTPVARWLAFLARFAPTMSYRMTPPRPLRNWLLLGTKPTPNLEERVLTAWRSVTPAVKASRVRAALQCNAHDDLVRVAVPILYLHPEDDRLLRRSCPEDFRELRPDVVFRRMAGPHLLIQRHPREAATAVAEWLGEHNLSE